LEKKEDVIVIMNNIDIKKILMFCKKYFRVLLLNLTLKNSNTINKTAITIPDKEAKDPIIISK